MDCTIQETIAAYFVDNKDLATKEKREEWQAAARNLDDWGGIANLTDYASKGDMIIEGPYGVSLEMHHYLQGVIMELRWPAPEPYSPPLPPRKSPSPPPPLPRSPPGLPLPPLEQRPYVAISSDFCSRPIVPRIRRMTCSNCHAEDDDGLISLVCGHSVCIQCFPTQTSPSGDLYCPVDDCHHKPPHAAPPPPPPPPIGDILSLLNINEFAKPHYVLPPPENPSFCERERGYHSPPHSSPPPPPRSPVLPAYRPPTPPPLEDLFCFVCGENRPPRDVIPLACCAEDVQACKPCLRRCYQNAAAAIGPEATIVHPKLDETPVMCPLGQAHPLFPLTKERVFTRQELESAENIESERAMREMEEQERQRKEREIEMKTYECPICSESKILDEMLLVGDCGHFVCKECSEQYIKSEFDSGKHEFACPQRCGRMLEYHDIQVLIKDRELLAKINDRIDHREFEKFAGAVYCPRGCGAGFFVDELSEAECPNCHTRFCTKCRDKPHPKETCEESRKRQEDNDSSLAASEKAMEKITKKCPKCRTPTEKAAACNHITCTQCKHEYCMVCLADYKGGHFNSPSTCPISTIEVDYDRANRAVRKCGNLVSGWSFEVHDTERSRQPLQEVRERHTREHKFTILVEGGEVTQVLAEKGWCPFIIVGAAQAADGRK